MAGFWGDARGVSEGISYVLSLGILLTLVVGTLLQGASVFQDASEESIEDQMEFESEQLAATFESVDRDVRATSSAGEIRRGLNLPAKFGGSEYDIRINDTSSGGVIIFDLANGPTVKTGFFADTDIQGAQLDGGDVSIVRPRGASTIKIVSTGE